ncbi:MAG: methyltransferase domain-containing protein [Nitrospirales bacterium]|nr:methyltransferase domain-containing protein [Nitrospira sp.]MDR4500776.1 methyltransferase domain-containing protein [Nitrospirales bacterium]
MNIVAKMKQDWDRRAKHHTRFWIATEDFQNEEVFAQSGLRTAEAILATLGSYTSTTWRVLDIGCGIGRVLKPLSPHFRHLTGVDVSAEMIAKSKTWLTDIKNVSTFETSGVDLSLFPSRNFHLVYSYVAFQHMPRPVFDRYVEEINRVLTPRGFLVFQLPIGRHQDAPLEDTIAVRSYEYEELEQKLKKNGFELIEATERDRSSLPSMARQNNFHGFFLAQKTSTIRPDINVSWIQSECREHASFLDTHMYLSFAERCLDTGDTEEAIQTYEQLLNHNPSSLEGWLQLTRVFIHLGKLDRAVSTLTALTQIHPTYDAGHRTLQELQRKCRQIEGAVRPIS